MCCQHEDCTLRFVRMYVRMLIWWNMNGWGTYHTVFLLRIVKNDDFYLFESMKREDCQCRYWHVGHVIIFESVAVSNRDRY